MLSGLSISFALVYFIQMKIKFFKFHGAGNDFLMIDNRDREFVPDRNLIGFMCSRHFGVGADGLITLQKSQHHDFEMRYYNSDGNESTMCGNGGRCIASFARMLGIVEKTTVFAAIDGIHEAIILNHRKEDDLVKLKMLDVGQVETSFDFFILNTGSPHYVKFVDNPSQVDVFQEGKKIRNDKAFFPDGINVNFVGVFQNEVVIRTYERGVEDETLACGTGAVAAAIAANLRHPGIVSPVDMLAKGGKLKVHFENQNGVFKNIWLEGPARFVFRGEIET
jgi:diaminopimelate epimerase